MRYLFPLYCLSLLSLNSYIGFAQSSADSFIITLNTKKQICPAYQAAYLRKVTKYGDIWHVEDYYAKEKTEEMEGNYLDSSLTIGDDMFYWYYPNGKYKGRGRFGNGKKQGIWRHYYENGQLKDSAYFRNDMHCKFAYEWRGNGKIVMKGIYDDSGKGTGTETCYYEDGIIDSYGKFASGYKKDSTWSYFYASGKIASKEYYLNGKMQMIDYYNLQGLLDSSVNVINHPSDTDKINNGELVYAYTMIQPRPAYNVNEYISKSLEYPDKARQDNVQGRINIQFIIDENGNITDVKPYKHEELGTDLENEAMRVIKGMPKWNPGRLHNRPVKVYFVLPVSFSIG